MEQLGLIARKPVFGCLRTTKAQTSRLISAFVIRVMESIISKLDTSEILIFYLVSVAEETGLSLTLWETPKTGFVATINFRHNKKGLKISNKGSLC